MIRKILTLSLPLLLGAATTTAATVEGPRGYLAAGEFDVTHVVEPAPRKGDPRYATDRAIFRATRELLRTPRGAMAAADADFAVPALLHDFSCSVGVELTEDNAPRIVAVVRRAGIDTGARTNVAKEYYQRARPFTIDRGPVCQPVAQLYDRTRGRMSFDYPSGHTTWGWTWALILSSIAPDRAANILARGRAYGDSRFVCGAHNESAVEAGMLSASATMNVVATKPAYQSDLALARDELTALRRNGRKPSGCDTEAALVNMRVMPSLKPVR